MTKSMSERGTFVEMAAKSIEKGIHGEEGALGACPSLGASCSTPEGSCATPEGAKVWNLWS